MGSGGFMAGLSAVGKRVGSAAKAGADSLEKSNSKQSAAGGEGENIGRKIGTKVRGVTQKYLNKKKQPKNGGPKKQLDI